MACNVHRTAADDACDALAALGHAEREITRLRAHLERVREGGTLPDAWQARRSASIVGALVDDVEGYTRGTVRRAEVPADALPLG